MHTIHASPRLAERFIDDDDIDRQRIIAEALLRRLDAQEPAPDQRATWERLIEENRALIA